MLLILSFFVEFLASLDVDVSVFNISTFFPVGYISKRGAVYSRLTYQARTYRPPFVVVSRRQAR